MACVRVCVCCWLSCMEIVWRLKVQFAAGKGNQRQRQTFSVPFFHLRWMLSLWIVDDQTQPRMNIEQRAFNIVSIRFWHIQPSDINSTFKYTSGQSNKMEFDFARCNARKNPFEFRCWQFGFVPLFRNYLHFILLLLLCWKVCESVVIVVVIIVGVVVVGR